MTQKFRHAPPRAAAMLEALRGLGYSTASALADIIDNSVSAGASDVHIRFDWNEKDSRVTILDNGCGMSDQELEEAMTLGTKNPLDERAPTDLGRFGMGLKTASFSQCRRLTVATRKNGHPDACLRWDLDDIAADPKGQWCILEGPDPRSKQLLSPLSEFSFGTLVLWENMDRIVSTGSTFNNFLDLIDNIELRLSMIFHRLLEDCEYGFRLFINGKRVAPWDPFMMGHPGKPWESPTASFQSHSGVIVARCHVLTHQDRLSGEEYEKAGGPEGWTSQQGFYVYRNRRLLLAGSWLGLGQGRAWVREESHRLARISLDLPNTADADWKIDIKKSTARPPVFIRSWLTRLAEDTRVRARKVFAYRGVPVARSKNKTVEQAWRVERLRNGIRYRIDETHPTIAAVMEACALNLPLLKAMLRVIEETVPVQRIWLDTAENKDTPLTGFDGEPNAAIIEVAAVLFNDLIERKGYSIEQAKKSILKTEPFHKYPALIARLGEKQ